MQKEMLAIILRENLIYREMNHTRGSPQPVKSFTQSHTEGQAYNKWTFSYQDMKAKLAEELGADTQVLTTAIPHLLQIVGMSSSTPLLPAQETSKPNIILTRPFDS
jgi:hypothetical protein